MIIFAVLLIHLDDWQPINHFAIRWFLFRSAVMLKLLGMPHEVVKGIETSLTSTGRARSELLEKVVCKGVLVYAESVEKAPE